MKLNLIPAFLRGGSIARMLVTTLCAAFAISASAAEITIQPDEDESKDSFVYSFLTSWAFDSDSAGPGSAFGDLLSAGATTSGAHDTLSYLEFSLFELEQLSLTGNNVQSAELYVYVVSTSGAGFGGSPSASFPVDVSVYEVEDDWTETTLTWANRPSYSNNVDTVTVNTTGYWISFDVTSTVKDWLDGNINNRGFALEQDNPVSNGSNQVVAVFDSSAGLNKPYLKVTY